MIEQLIAMALRFRAAVVGGTLLLIGAGAWALATINLDAFPDLTPNQVEVHHRGTRPVAERSRKPRQLSARNRHDGPASNARASVRSRRPASPSLRSSFEDDVEMYLRAGAGPAAHAGGCRGPAPGPASHARTAATPMGEVFQYLVESDSISLMELNNLQEYTIKPLLRTIPGVADMNTWGGMVQQFHVDADPQPPDRLWADLCTTSHRRSPRTTQLWRRIHRDARRAADDSRSRARGERKRYRAVSCSDTQRRHADSRPRRRRGDRRTDAARRRRVARRPRRSAGGQ